MWIPGVVFYYSIIVIARIEFQSEPIIPSLGNTMVAMSSVVLILIQILSRKGGGVSIGLSMRGKGVEWFDSIFPLGTVALTGHAIVVRQVSVMEIPAGQNGRSTGTAHGRVHKGVGEGHAVFLQQLADTGHVIEASQAHILIVRDQQQNVRLGFVLWGDCKGGGRCRNVGRAILVCLGRRMDTCYKQQ